MEKIRSYREDNKDFSKTFRRIVQEEVVDHLALVFHRFYGSLHISINNERIPQRDPFLDDSNHCINRPEIIIPTGTEYPIRVRAYRLPAESDLNEKELKLIGGKNSLLTEDGLYIYRNDRLIAWGSWMKLEHRNLYTHLARVKIDIPSSIDQEWGLDVKKSQAVLPDSIKDKIRPAINDGIEQSTKRTRYVGKKEGDAGVDRVWTRIKLEDNKIKYELNEKYPSFQQLKETLSKESKALLSAYLKDIVEYVPVSNMRDDVADSLLAINGTNNDEDDSLMEDLFTRVDSCNPTSVEKGVELLDWLLGQERFFTLKKKRLKVIEKYRSHYESR